MRRVGGGDGATGNRRAGRAGQLAGVDRRGGAQADPVHGLADCGVQGSVLAVGQARVRAGGAPHRLGGVVDQDVQRARGGDLVGQVHDLCRVAQVDADDAQAVQPLRRVGLRGEAAHGVLGEAGGDGQVGAVAKQPQRDVHADFRPPTGEQRPAAGEVAAGVAPPAVLVGALRAQLVVEPIDERERLLADVAILRPQQLAGETLRIHRATVDGLRQGTGGQFAGRLQVQAQGLVVDAVGAAGGGGLDDRAVGGQARVAGGAAAIALDLLEQAAHRPLQRHRIRVLRVEVAAGLEHPQARRQILRGDALVPAVHPLIHSHASSTRSLLRGIVAVVKHDPEKPRGGDHVQCRSWIG